MILEKPLTEPATATSKPLQLAVQAGVDAYAEAEAGLKAAHAALLKLPAVYTGVFKHSNAPFPVYGYLRSEADGARARSLAGRIADLLGEVIEAHQADTNTAVAMGIDLPNSPDAMAMRPLGGGR